MTDGLETLRAVVRAFESQPGQVRWYDWWREDGIELQCTCIACPVQFEGMVDGERAYFRERHGEWRFTIGPDPIAAPDDGSHRTWEGESSHPSWTPHAEAKAVIRRCVAQWRRARLEAEE